jgi:plasmid stability protein
MMSSISKSKTDTMANLTVRNIPEDVHRALRVRAARHGRSTEAEIRDILEKAAKPEGRLKLGSLLVAIAREAGGLTDAEAAHFDRLRDRTPAEPTRFE